MIPQQQVLTVVLTTDDQNDWLFINCGFPPVMVEGFRLKTGAATKGSAFVAVKGVTDTFSGKEVAGMAKVLGNGTVSLSLSASSVYGIKFRDRGIIIGNDPDFFRTTSDEKVVLRIYPDQEELNLDLGDADPNQSYKGFTLGYPGEQGRKADIDNADPTKRRMGGGGSGPFKATDSFKYATTSGGGEKVQVDIDKYSRIGVYKATAND